MFFYCSTNKVAAKFLGVPKIRKGLSIALIQCFIPLIAPIYLIKKSYFLLGNFRLKLVLNNLYNQKLNQ